MTENILVIEKLMRNYPAAEKNLGRDRGARRQAHLCNRLTKGLWRRKQSDVAREALQQAIGLRPFALKYRLHRLQFGWREQVTA